MPPVSGMQAQLAERLDEARRSRRDDDVAGERQIGARAGGHAVDRADHGKRQRPQRQQQRLVVAFDRCAEIDRLAAGRHGTIAEILAGAEAAARAGQQQHARGGVGLHLAECVTHFGVHRVGEAVEPVGAVQRQPRDAAVLREENAFVAHGHTCTRCCTTRKRPATNAASVSAALAAGLAPVP